jgi:hypothetical protein
LAGWVDGTSREAPTVTLSGASLMEKPFSSLP